MKGVTFDFSGTGKIFAIGANGNYLRHFVREFVRGGGAPDRLVVIRDAQMCVEPVCADIVGIAEHAIDADGLDDAIRKLRPGAAACGCVFAWHRLISTDVLGAFDGHLLNLHCGDLPRYRGAGGGSWQVLNGETKITAFIHRMTREMDRGDVLLREAESFVTAEPYPRDVKDAASRAGMRIIGRLVSALLSGRAVPTTQQDENDALYFPRLHTASNGWIDFSWPSADILRFVRAFSDPYPGASFRYREACYRVRRASLRNDVALHPFAIGLIVNRTRDAVHVAATDGIMAFTDIRTEDGAACAPERFRVGNRLWTSLADLSVALRFRPGTAA